jgi:hypothetical protein
MPCDDSAKWSNCGWNWWHPHWEQGPWPPSEDSAWLSATAWSSGGAYASMTDDSRVADSHSAEKSQVAGIVPVESSCPLLPNPMQTVHPSGGAYASMTDDSRVADSHSAEKVLVVGTVLVENPSPQITNSFDFLDAAYASSGTHASMMDDSRVAGSHSAEKLLSDGEVPAQKSSPQFLRDPYRGPPRKLHKFRTVIVLQ